MKPIIKYPIRFLKSLTYDNQNNGVTAYQDFVENDGWSKKEALSFLNEAFNEYPNVLSAYAGQLPEVVITPDKNQMRQVRLTTYYPGVSKYWATGHSKLETPGGNYVNVMSDDPDYNLLLNNCSDATREALEQATGKSINPWFFTTPGDVRTYAEDVLGGRSINRKDGSVTTLINLPQYQINKIAQYAQKLRQNKILYNRQQAIERREKLLSQQIKK